MNKEISAQRYEKIAKYLTESKRQSWVRLLLKLLLLPYHGCIPNYLTFCCPCPTPLILVLFLQDPQTPLTFLLFLCMEMGWNMATAFMRCPELSEKNKAEFHGSYWKAQEEQQMTWDISYAHGLASSSRVLIHWVLMSLKEPLFHACTPSLCCWKKDHGALMLIRIPCSKKWGSVRQPGVHLNTTAHKVCPPNLRAFLRQTERERESELLLPKSDNFNQIWLLSNYLVK